MTQRLLIAVSVCCLAQALGVSAVARAQAPLRKITEMELSLVGLSAAPDPINPAVPKDTPAGIRVAVKGGHGNLALPDVVRFLGPDFEIRGELAGPGLVTPIALTQPAKGSSLLLPLPALNTAGTYAISNLRIVSGNHTVLDVTPSHVALQVITQVLITSVVTRPLTLQEIKDKGIVLEKDDVIGFDFTLALKLESTPIQVTFPVVFDRTGVPVPTGITPPSLIERAGVDVPTIVPMMLSIEDTSGLMMRPALKLPDGREVVVKIPALLVIPGNTGFLKQFFSAQLYVQNGAPGGTNLVVRDITGTIVLPKGDDALPKTADDPLSLPATNSGPQLPTQPVRGVGPDGVAGTTDDVNALAAGETGQVEFLLRGDQEGYHSIEFDINATLDGLATGSIPVKGHANGGVLVRNPYFDVTFTAPSVARRGEPFTLNMTLTNIGQGAANQLTVALDASRMSGTHVSGDSSQTVDSIAPGESKTLKFKFISEATGQVVAHYLRFDPQGAAATGRVNFTVGVGERGVQLSPDTLVLPAVVDNLPTDVVDAAMRVLGQAWSIANAPVGTLPPTVIRTTKSGVTHKALALAEAGLRVNLGQPLGDALRDFGLDFYGGITLEKGLDNGFDQLLRQTDAGRAFAHALGAALGPVAMQAGGALSWQRAMADVAASGPDLVTFAVAADGGAAPANLALTDASGKRTTLATDSEDASTAIKSAALLSLGAPGFAPAAGLVTEPTASPYTLSWTSVTAGGSVDLSVSLPRGDGTVVRGSIVGAPIPSGAHARVVIDTARADSLMLESDADGDGVFEAHVPLSLETLTPSGPRALAAVVIGPETVSGAQPFGFNMAVLFDRATNEASASKADNFQIPSNNVLGSHRQLSGRLVFASLSRPEGPYVPTTVAISGIVDNRGAPGPSATLPLTSRLRDPGAVVRGRVLAADGKPVSSGVVTFLENADYQKCEQTDPAGFSAIPLGVDGRFEFRYVRQDNCGLPWHVSAHDPVTGALREVGGYVRAGGEQIEADIVLFGRGNLTGIVRDLLNRPVPGATVVAVSVTDNQSGGQATTDGDGRYTIFGLTVGVVNVRAAKGISGGRTTGNVPRAGDTGTANLTLDGGTVNVTGTVRKISGGATTSLAGAVVVYYLRESGFTAVGVARTKVDGTYSIPQLPVGPYRIESFIDNRSRGAVEGVAAAGDSLVKDIAIVIDEGVTVRGRVVMPDNSPAPNTVVTVDSRGVLTSDDGSFVIPDVRVGPWAQTVTARSRDGLRQGQTTVTITDASQPIPDLLIALSGVGSVDLLVVDPLGNPIAGQEVAIVVPCARSCGCALKIGITGANGRVRFDGLPVGSVTASAVRLVRGFGDEAVVRTSIPRDGAVVFDVLRYSGFGVVTGTVLGPDGLPTEGADVALQSNTFTSENACGLTFGPSQSVRTDTAGRFRFNSVNLGRVGVTTTHPFFDTTVGASDTLTANGQQIDFTLTLKDTIAGELSGTIFLPDGTTPVGVGVKVTMTGQLPDVTVPTNEQGHFRFAKIFPQGYYRITARDPVTGGIGYETVYLNHGQDAVHNVRLKGEGTVRVHVVDGADQPVDSAFITLRETAYPSRVFEASLDPSNQGVATFEHVFEGHFSLQVTDVFGRGARPAFTLPGPGQTLDVKARLTTTGTVRGHFFAPDHVTPVPFAIIQLLEYWRYGVIGQMTAAGTGDVGSFEFTHVPAGLVRVRGTDPLTGRTGLGVGTVTNEGEIVTINVIATGVGTVHGVVKSNGAPQPGAHVTVVSGNYSAGTLTDADGIYVVGGVPEGPVTATASLGNGFLQGTAGATLVGEGTDLAIDVALRDSGAIDGVLVEADGTTPGPISVITAQSGGFGGGTQSTTTDLAGGFHFDRAPVGLATLSADVLGSIDQGTLSVDVPSGGRAQVTLVLNGVGSIDGVARDSLNQPIAGTITITGTGPVRYTQTATASIDGAFHLTEVLAGPFTAALRSTVNGITLYGNATGVVTPDRATPLTIRLQDAGTVSGLVLRPDGTTPAIGAGITILLDHNRGSLDVQTNADGRFSVAGVPLGGFSVSVFDAGNNGVGRAINQHLDVNGATADVGTIALDNTPFSVVSIDPADGSTNVAARQPTTIVLSAPMDQATGLYFLDVTESRNYLYFLWTFSADGKTITICCGLPDGRDIAVELTPLVRDVYGRHLLQTVTSRFHTRDITPPTIAAVTPKSGSTQVPMTTPITVTFSEALLPTQDLSTLITVRVNGSGAAVATGTTVLASPTQAVFTANPPLASDTNYEIIISGAKDLTGNVQVSGYHVFVATIDTTPPTTTSLLPADHALTSNNRPTIQWAFDAGVVGSDTATTYMSVDDLAVPASVSINAVTFAPPAPLADGLHTAQASTSDRAGNAASVSWSFTVDATPPPVPAIVGVVEGQVLIGTLSVGASSTDATSAVVRYDVQLDNSAFLTLTAPSFSGTFNTINSGDGPHTLTARAIDAAGNASAFSAPLHFIINNKPLTMTYSSPVANTRFRSSAPVTVYTSEPPDHVTFTAGTTSVPAIALNTTTFTAAVPLSTAPEGPAVITATAYGLLGEVVTTTLNVIVDRTPPPAPDASRIDAEPPVAGAAYVIAFAGATEAGALIRATNMAGGAAATTTAAGDGSFSFSILAAADDQLTITATDSVGNQSAATIVVVRRTPLLPPAVGNSSLHYEGVLVDRVGPASGALAPDGALDAVFTLTLSIGDELTRVLSYIDLVGPGTRSTRVGAGGALGVAASAGGTLLNIGNGTVAFPITSGATLTLIASDGGFIQPGASYTATAVFTDGSRFVGTFTIVAPEDRTAIAHSAIVTANPVTVRVTSSSNPGTTTLTLSDIRDIEGTRVPDGAKVALTAADMATKDPRNVAIRSAGGAIVDGVTAANNASFKVFTVAGGSITATYSSLPVMPTAYTGALSVIQVMAADANGNVLGDQAIATFDLSLRAATDIAIGSTVPSSLFVDKADRRVHVTFAVAQPDGAKVGVTTADSWVLANGAWVSGSAGGSILGGTPVSGTAYQAFTVASGKVEFDYSPGALTVPSGTTRTAIIGVVALNANGGFINYNALGTATITLTGAGAAELRLSTDNIPLVYPTRTVQAVVHHVHDERANLVPDGVKVLVTAADSWTLNPTGTAWITSAGGSIVDGQTVPGHPLRMFPLTSGEVLATYSPDNIQANPGETKTANIGVLVGDTNGLIIDYRSVASAPIRLNGVTNAAPASVTPSTLMADGGVFTATVTFGPVLDAFGNTVPDGTKVLATVADSWALNTAGTAWILSDGGQILNGEAVSNTAMRLFTVQSGKIVVTYSDQSITTTPGQIKTARLSLLESNAVGAIISYRALGTATISLVGTTSATASVNPTYLHADGADRRVTVTVTGIVDAAGRPVPDGTKLVASAADSDFLNAQGTAWILSAGGAIVGGTPSTGARKIVTVQNGQVVFEYSAQNVSVSSGTKTAVVQIAAVSQAGVVLSNKVIASVPIQLLGEASAVISVSPSDLYADNGAHLAQVTISNLQDAGGATMPDGAKVGVTVTDTVTLWQGQWVLSAGGVLTPAGTSPGDGTVSSTYYQIYTVTGGQVRLSYSDQNLNAAVNQSKTARISVAPASSSGAILSNNAIAVGTVTLRGVASAVASGATTAVHSGPSVQVTFSGIKDTANNLVPDGALIAATVTSGVLRDPATGAYLNTSIGGTITDGTPAATYYRVFAVHNGSITLTYQAPTAGAGTAVIAIVPALSPTSINGNLAIPGGIWSIAIQ